MIATVHLDKEEMMNENGTYEGMTGYMDESGELLLRQTVSGFNAINLCLIFSYHSVFIKRDYLYLGCLTRGFELKACGARRQIPHS